MLKRPYGEAASQQPALLNPANMLDARLLKAFMEKDLKKFQRILFTITETTEPEKLPYTVLGDIMYKAASIGLQEFCDVLAPYASRRHYLDGILNFASMMGHVKAMDYLKDCGANLRNHDDQPLRSAILGQQQESVDYLQEHGCDLSVAMNPAALKAIHDMPGCKGALVFAFLSMQDSWAGHSNDPAPNIF